MMTVQIDRFHSRARLPYDAHRLPLARRQLAGATDRLIDTLPELLEAYGLPPTAHICIRSLVIKVRLAAPALRDGDALARAWAAAIAEAISGAYGDPSGSLAATGDGEATELVVYRTDAAAFADLIAGLARGDQRRRWAWEQLRLCRPGGSRDLVDLLVEACAARRQTALPALRWAASAGHLDRLQLSWPQWERLAAVVLPAAVRGMAAASDLPTIGRADRVRAALALSPLVTALARSAHRLGPPPPALRPALAQLALAADAPELPRDPLTVVRVVPWLFPRGAASEADATPSETARADPQLSSNDRERGREAAATSSPAGSAGDIGSSTHPQSPPSQLETRNVSSLDSPPAPMEPAAWTSYGGLPFLLNLQTVRALDPPTRSVRWTLAALGRRLSGAAEDDPGLRALVGLPTLAPMPPELRDPPTPTDLDELARLTDQIEAELARRLPGLELTAAELPGYVIRRPARIVADPGWIEVILPLECVDIELRRAGLDLDPRPVQFLGGVVRFRYE